jgi:hypothetical protein
VSWDPERYREKRERVLAGNGNQGSGFVKVLLGAVLGVFVLGLVLGGPAVWNTFSMRHLDDVILRVDGAAHAASLLHEGEGIRQVREDHGGNRLVVTFDRRETSAKGIVERLKASGADCFLLNTMPHNVGERQRKEMAHEAH